MISLKLDHFIHSTNFLDILKHFCCLEIYRVISTTPGMKEGNDEDLEFQQKYGQGKSN
jgi:hypothetical protein